MANTEKLRAVVAAVIATGACRSAPELVPGASLVALSKQPAGEDFQRVGNVRCLVDEHLPKPQMLEQCHTLLRNEAAGLDADLVVVEVESAGTADCPACVEMRGSAFRRLLPYERVVVTPTRTEVRAAAKLSSATGFVVDTRGTILTANHAVENARTIVISMTSGVQAVANVSRRIEQLDVAVLKIDAQTPEYVSLGDASSVRLGEPVWTLGFPVMTLLGISPKFSEGSISSLTGSRDAPEFFQASLPIQPGNSGGPLLTEAGYAVGIVTATADAIPFLRATGTLPQGINWAVKADPAKALFVQPPRVAPAASRAQAIDYAKRAVCLVESIEGEGLVVAPSGFGSGFTPQQVAATAFDRQRAQCERGDPEACLSVARIVVSECKARTEGICRHTRFARTILSHACGTGRSVACATLRG